mmetsp:Transcript_409/g.1420  ORF Transcript_409/g.1420 Transcript_409/m.1420 type:complete len:473 (+) Transcript_409:56-1474(+)
MGQAAAKEVPPKTMAKLVQEYTSACSQPSGSSGRFTDEEIAWLLKEFVPKAQLFNPKVQITSQKQLLIPKKVAEKNMQVYNQVFANYPKLTARLWCAISDPSKPDLTFREYAEFLHAVTRGSFAAKLSLVTRFVKGEDVNKNTVTKAEVVDMVRTIARYLATVARGVVTMEEIVQSKQRAIDALFTDLGANEVTVATFVTSCVEYQALWRCFDILDMLFGRVPRKMEHDLKEPRVFERFVQEGALGNAKDVSGKFPFVPEVIASSIQYLKDNDGLGAQGIFRLAPSKKEQSALLDALDKEMSLHCYMAEQPVTKESMVLVADVMKRYCDRVRDSVLTDEAMAAFCSAATSADPVPQLVKLFNDLPLPNRQLASTLVSFMHELKCAQEEKLSAGDRLNTESIAVLFSPVLLRIPSDISDPGLAIKMTGDSRIVIKIMIENHESFKPPLVDSVRRVAPPRPGRRPSVPLGLRKN